MALNNIELNSLLLIDLYRNSLIEINEVKKNVVADQSKIEKNDSLTKEWKFLGEFRKNILLVVRYNGLTHLPDESLNFLTSILIACKLSLADVAILNISNQPSALYKDVQKKFRGVTTVLFGITPQEFEMPLSFPEFQVQPFDNCTFLYAPVLEKLESDKILKSKLWVCLRRMFSLP
jgi:hypothetical protein